ncbi:MAG: alpha/beta hydrolase [Clostridia bacterium]|nr:alpha/beta hydrolase [Clostridia bacterium]
MMNPIAKKLFVGGTLLSVQPMRLGQYYLNKAAFDKAESVPGVYELSDIPYKEGQKKPRSYNGKQAAMGFGRTHLLDIEAPTPLVGKDLEKLPVIISVHGGGYVTNNKECNRPHCQYLASRGFKVVNLNYTLQPEGEMDEEMRDIRDAVAWVEKNADQYGFDLSNVFMTGDSSGGHMVLLYTGLQNSEAFQEKIGVKVPATKVKATAATCPVGSYVAKDLVSRVFKNLSGRLYDDEMKLAYSYEGFADATYPEVLIVTTKTDIPIHYSTKGIHEHLDKVGAKHQYIVFEGQENKLGHVFNVLHPEWSESIEANQAILSFFESKKV